MSERRSEWRSAFLGAIPIVPEMLEYCPPNLEIVVMIENCPFSCRYVGRLSLMG